MGDKCANIFLGGTHIEQGHAEDPTMPRSCSSLKCKDCNQRVHRYANASWNDLVDSTFVRSNIHNLDALETGLTHNPGHTAYACECKFTTVSELDEELWKELQWMCGGHGGDDHSHDNTHDH